MNTMSEPTVDVLAWFDDLIRNGEEHHTAEAKKTRAAVAELLEAAKRANGGHCAPYDCYATGPMTGNPIADLVACPGCALAAALARIGSSK